MANTTGKKFGGREKGAKNKFTKQFKDLLTETYSALETDNKFGLIKWAKDNQTDFYKICSKLIPIQLTGKDGEGLFQSMTEQDKQDIVNRIKHATK